MVTYIGPGCFPQSQKFFVSLFILFHTPVGGCCLEKFERKRFDAPEPHQSQKSPTADSDE